MTSYPSDSEVLYPIIGPSRSGGVPRRESGSAAATSCASRLHDHGPCISLRKRNRMSFYDKGHSAASASVATRTGDISSLRQKIQPKVLLLSVFIVVLCLKHVSASTRASFISGTSSIATEATFFSCFWNYLESYFNHDSTQASCSCKGGIKFFCKQLH